MVVRVAVLGAGINGVACALRIKERYRHYQVVIISEKFSPDTTADGAGGLWYPYLVGNTPESLLTKWGGETYEYLHKLWLEGGCGVCYLPCVDLYPDGHKWREPSWAGAVFGYRVLGERHLKILGELYNDKFEAGQAFSTFVVTSTPFLKHLMQRFLSLKGELLRARVVSLQSALLRPCHVVVNCLGLGAAQVLPDTTLYPIRGQVARVVAPWINECVFDGRGHYIIPNESTCVLGGTHQENDYNTNLDANDTDFVVKGCQKVMPTLKHARLYQEWVGLRPARDAVRLEAERSGQQLIIHNYGHGGSGLTLFWGCASDVLQLIDKHLHNVSKL